MRMHFYILLLLSLILSGCAAPYHRAKPGGWFMTGIGYYDKEVGNNKYMLEYHGNGYSDDDYVLKQYHKRAKELCSSDYITDVKVIKATSSYFNEMRCQTNSCVDWPVASGRVICKDS